jgi:hypothetical protein
MEVRYSARKCPPLITVVSHLSLVQQPRTILLLSIHLHRGLPSECVTVLVIFASLPLVTRYLQQLEDAKQAGPTYPATAPYVGAWRYVSALDLCFVILMA